MYDYTFVYRAPRIRKRGRVRLCWETTSTSYQGVSDRDAVMKARRILRESRIDFDGAYCIGTAVALLTKLSGDTFEPLRSTALGLR